MTLYDLGGIMKKSFIMLLILIMFSMLSSCSNDELTEVSTPTKSNIMISNKSLNWISLHTVNYTFSVKNNNEVSVIIDFMITYSPSGANSYQVSTTKYTLEPNEIKIISLNETVGVYESCNASVVVNNLNALDDGSQLIPTVTSTTAQQAFNSGDFVASLDIIGDGAGTWKNSASFSVYLQWSFNASSKYNLSHSITTNITVTGYVDFNYVYFDSSNNYHEDTKRQYFTAILYKNQNYQNKTLVSASIYISYGNEIAALATSNMRVSSVSGTLVRK